MVTNKFCVGLTGGIGCGKSTATASFKKLGAQIIDTDVIARELTQSNGLAIPAIKVAFGITALLPNGSLNRPAMRALIFNNAIAKQQLESILHPLILDDALAQLHAPHPAPYAILVAPLLLQSPLFIHHVQRITLVDCTEELQIQRVMQRGQISEAEVRSIIAQQTSRQSYLERADDILHNEGDLNSLWMQVCQLHQKYLQKSVIND
jgi:dephospho-CoA kinase